MSHFGAYARIVCTISGRSDIQGVGPGAHRLIWPEFQFVLIYRLRSQYRAGLICSQWVDELPASMTTSHLVSRHTIFSLSRCCQRPWFGTLSYQMRGSSQPLHFWHKFRIDYCSACARRDREALYLNPQRKTFRYDRSNYWKQPDCLEP